MEKEEFLQILQESKEYEKELENELKKAEEEISSFRLKLDTVSKERDEAKVI